MRERRARPGACDGVLQDTIEAEDAGHPMLRRYWIEL